MLYSLFIVDLGIFEEIRSKIEDGLGNHRNGFVFLSSISLLAPTSSSPRFVIGHVQH